MIVMTILSAATLLVFIGAGVLGDKLLRFRSRNWSSVSRWRAVRRPVAFGQLFFMVSPVAPTDKKARSWCRYRFFQEKRANIFYQIREENGIGAFRRCKD